MPISEAQRKAVRKYNAKAYDRLEISVPKGRKAEYQAYAESRGESLNGLVNRAIDNQVKQDKVASVFTVQSKAKNEPAQDQETVRRLDALDKFFAKIEGSDEKVPEFERVKLREVEI